MTKPDGGPAFPHFSRSRQRSTDGYVYHQDIETGMSLRAYAAIKLRIPDSGIDWLDEMITRAKRDELAKAAMEGLLAQSQGTAIQSSADEGSEYAYKFADAMLSESEKTK